MKTAVERRRVAEQVQAAAGVSERQTIRFTGFPRSTVRYRSLRDPQEEPRARIRELAAQRVRWGYRQIHTLLVREGWVVNRKRIQRLYREEGLAVRRKGKRRRSQAPRPVREPLGRPNERWSMDFVTDTLSNGRRFRCLNIIDEFSRECLAIHVAHSIPAVRVIEVLERLRAERGLPEIIMTTTARSSQAGPSTLGPTPAASGSTTSSRANRCRTASSRASTGPFGTSA